jgi:hypothetical protein
VNETCLRKEIRIPRETKDGSNIGVVLWPVYFKQEEEEEEGEEEEEEEEEEGRRRGR